MPDKEDIKMELWCDVFLACLKNKMKINDAARSSDFAIIEFEATFTKKLKEVD